MADSVAGLCTQLDSLLLDQPYLGTDEATFLLDDNRYIIAHKNEEFLRFNSAVLRIRFWVSRIS